MIDIELMDISSGPVYAQIRNQIETSIRAKQVAAGEALPSPASLAQKLSVDRGEIQRAYFELERAGLIVRKTSRDFLGKEKITYSVK
ncbi:MAG: GntR family transcriptional regulator [Pyrinomonadaceae bacterium]